MANHREKDTEIEPANVYYDERKDAWTTQYQMPTNVKSISVTMHGREKTIGVSKKIDEATINIAIDDGLEVAPIDDIKVDFVEQWINDPYAPRAPVDETPAEVATPSDLLIEHILRLVGSPVPSINSHANVADVHVLIRIADQIGGAKKKPNKKVGGAKPIRRSARLRQRAQGAKPKK